MNRAEARSLLTEVKRSTLKDPAAEVKDSLLDYIMSKFDLSNDGQLERTELLPAVKKYKALMLHDQKLQALFERHDTDGTKRLSPPIKWRSEP